MGSNININLWLQEELLTHAEELFQKKYGLEFVSKERFYISNGVVSFEDYNGDMEFELSIKEILKDYLNSEE